MAVTGAGLEGIIATQSRICFIDGDAGILAIMGFNIHTLAEKATFEEIIFLLWNGRLPKQAELDQLKAALVANREIDKNVAGFLKGVGKSAPMDVLRTAVSMLSLYDPQAKDMSPEANQQKAIKLMAQTATIVTSFDRLRNGKEVVAGDPSLGFAANFLYTLTGKKPDDVMERAIDVALILHADHELNASTFAARVVAATLSDIYSAVTAGIGALKGPLHGGANEDVIKMLLEAGSAEKAIEHVKNMLANEAEGAGFRTSRVSHDRSARDASGGAVGRARQAHRPRGAVPDVEADREVHEGNQESERQRRFLFGIGVLFAGDSDRPVHADFRGEPHVGLDGARAGAISATIG